MSLVLLAGCTCAPAPLQRVQPAKLTADPSPLVLPRAWVGQTTRAIVQVTNVGEAAATVEVSLDAPFETATAQLRVVGPVAGLEVGGLQLQDERLVSLVRGEARVESATHLTDVVCLRPGGASGACAVSGH